MQNISKQKILVVEDDPRVRDMICQYLGKHGFVDRSLSFDPQYFQDCGLVIVNPYGVM